MSIHRHHFLVFVIGSGALLLFGRLQVGAFDHKLLLIGWTVIFYGALSISEKRAPMQAPFILASEGSPNGVEAVDEFFDEDRIAMQQDGYHWDPDAVTDSSSENI